MTFLLFEINCQQILDLLTFRHPLPVKTKNLSSPTLSLLSKPYLSPGSWLKQKNPEILDVFFFPYLPSLSSPPTPPSNLLSSPIAFAFQIDLESFYFHYSLPMPSYHHLSI